MKQIVAKLIKLFMYLKLRKKAVLLGEIDFYRTSKISLIDGSNNSDIILGNNVRMYGTLISQNHGKIIFEDNVKIGADSVVGSVCKILIRKGTIIAHEVNIVDNNNHPVNPDDRIIMVSSPWDSPFRKWRYSDCAAIEIGENVWIGQNARICKGVSVGNNSIIAANSVVTKSVPENSIVAGNPAKIVKTDIDKVARKLC